MTLPLASRTVRVTQAWKPLTGYSIRFVAPGRRLVVYWIESVARWKPFVVGRLNETVRPVGGPQISKRTKLTPVTPRMRIGYLVSLRKRMLRVAPPVFQTVASRPTG